MIEPKKLAELVARAKNGDDDAVSQLYSDCYGRIFYVIKSIVGDEETTMDLLQDTFLKAFKSINSLEDNQAFYAWLKRIALNTSKNWLIKSRPILFSDLQNPTVNDEEDAEPVENVFEDPKLENMPEEVVDKAEVSRLLNEILDSLPADQRLAICMFYYDDMSLKEIAEVMDVPLSTVKNRLAYGRKKVEQKVLDLEKRGTKIYGLAPITFLLFLFKGMETQAKELHPDQTALNSFRKAVQAGQNQSAAMDMAGKVAKEATKAGKKVVETVGVKMLAIIGAVAVIGIAGISFIERKPADVNSDYVKKTEDALYSETETKDEDSETLREKYFMESIYYDLRDYIRGMGIFDGISIETYDECIKNNISVQFSTEYVKGSDMQTVFIKQDNVVHAFAFRMYTNMDNLYMDGWDFRVEKYDPENCWYYEHPTPSSPIHIYDASSREIYYFWDDMEKYSKYNPETGEKTAISKEESEEICSQFTDDLSTMGLEWQDLTQENIDHFFAPYLE